MHELWPRTAEFDAEGSARGLQVRYNPRLIRLCLPSCFGYNEYKEDGIAIAAVVQVPRHQ